MVNIKIIQLIFLDDCFRQFGWDTVTAFSQNEEVYSLAVNELVTQLEAANITCAASITFAESDFKEQLQQLKVTWVLRPSSAFQISLLPAWSLGIILSLVCLLFWKLQGEIHFTTLEVSFTQAIQFRK